jgi:ribonucleoside-diphosphate reductase alpha chain
MELSKNAMTVLERRYLKKHNGVTETPETMFKRVAEAVVEAEWKFTKDSLDMVVELEEKFYNMMTNLEFLPNSPTLMNAGCDIGQLSACFVLPVGDSMPEIFDAVKNAAIIHKSGGGTGFSFSRLRPANDVVKSTSGISSGPVSFMNVFNAATETVKQGGTRRGANMAVLRVDHPDIMDFIMCKADKTKLNNFNISVGITDKFMQAVAEDEDYDLINPRDNSVHGRLSAKKVFHRIITQAWENGEPGVLFLDEMNRHNPTPHMGEYECSNPCGEQMLLPYESCNLGSINLTKMIKEDSEGVYRVDYPKIRITVDTAVNFLDNVIEMNRFPLPEIREATLGNRKIGLGVMGWADMLIKMGIPYNSVSAIQLAQDVMGFIQEQAYAASRELALTRGSYPNQNNIEVYHEVRNSTRTTIAPTGTLSIIANCSSGIEPVFAVSYYRTVMDNDVLVEVNPEFERIAKERGFYSKRLMERIADEGIQNIDEIPDDIKQIFKTAHDISPEEHVNMQAAFQLFTDNAVSKTVNFPKTATPEDVASVIYQAYSTGCKGITVYRDGSRDNQVLAQHVKRERPRELTGRTYQQQTGCGPLYITVNEDDGGIFELFTTMGKAGGCAASQNEAIGRLVSLAWRHGISDKQVVKQLRGISCHSPYGFGEKKVLSCADAVAQAIEYHMRDNGKVFEKAVIVLQKGACPECGGIIHHEGGCAYCRECGYSECV